MFTVKFYDEDEIKNGWHGWIEDENGEVKAFITKDGRLFNKDGKERINSIL